jgi:hypothetical protein
VEGLVILKRTTSFELQFKKSRFCKFEFSNKQPRITVSRFQDLARAKDETRRKLAIVVSENATFFTSLRIPKLQ